MIKLTRSDSITGQHNGATLISDAPLRNHPYGALNTQNHDERCLKAANASKKPQSELRVRQSTAALNLVRGGASGKNAAGTRLGIAKSEAAAP